MESQLLSIVYLAIALIMSITLHEFAHAYVSDLLGDRTARQEGRISLNPLAHIDPFMTLLLPVALIVLHSPVIFGAAKPVPFNPWAVKFGRWGAALVAAAGPAMNLLLAVFFALWLHLVAPSGGAVELFRQIIVINISFMIFNLLPIPPLDGSRIVYAAIPAVRDTFDRLEEKGMIIIFGLLLLAGPIFLPIISALTRPIINILIPGVTNL